MEVESLLAILASFAPVLGTTPRWFSLRRILSVRRNLLQCSTIAAAGIPDKCRLGEEDYVVFTLDGYTRIPRKYKLIRWRYRIYRTLCIFVIVLAAFAIALPIYAVCELSALPPPSTPASDPPTQTARLVIPSESAKIVISGGVVAWLSIFIVGFMMKHFDEDYHRACVKVDENGQHTTVKVSVGADVP